MSTATGIHVLVHEHQQVLRLEPYTVGSGGVKASIPGEPVPPTWGEVNTAVCFLLDLFHGVLDDDL